MATALSTPQSAADADALDAFRAWLATDLLTRTVAQALVVSALRQDQAPPVRAPNAVTMLPWSSQEGESGALKPGFAEGSFDAVYVHRMVRVAVPATWLDAVRRVLKPGGTILAVADPVDFIFAPLPAGGDVLLLCRVLQAAGFHRTALVCRTPRLIVVAARC